MEKSTGQSSAHQRAGVQSLGRGPGVRAASGSSIQIDFTWKGRRYRERLALAPTPKNIKYAKRLKATVEHEIATHTFDFHRHFPESARAQSHDRKGNFLSAALQAYCSSLGRQLEPETARKYRQDAAIIARAFRGETLHALTRAKIRTWVNRQTLSKKRLNNLLIPLRGVFRQAVEDGILEQDPMAGFVIRRAAPVSDRIDPFTPAEIAALAATELGYLWKFWAATGLRSGELIGLEWGDVSDTALTVRRSVRVGRVKAPKTAAGVRVVKLLPAASEILRSVRPAEAIGAVFINPATGQRWH